MEIGDVFEMEVESVRGFGVYGTREGYTVLVLIPDVSWIASFASCEQIASPGDSMTVKILGVNPQERLAAASMKALHPDPWQEPSQLLAGSTVEGTVVRYVQSADRCDGRPGYLVSVAPGAYAMLCDNGADLNVGDKCSIRIVAARPHRRAVEVELAAE